MSEKSYRDDPVWKLAQALYIEDESEFETPDTSMMRRIQAAQIMYQIESAHTRASMM